MMIPILIIIAFTTKGVSLYLAKVIMINVGEDIKKKLQFDKIFIYQTAITSHFFNFDKGLHSLMLTKSPTLCWLFSSCT